VQQNEVIYITYLLEVVYDLVFSKYGMQGFCFGL
jgi:hypothetical protein